MKTALIADIHGNAYALEAVLAELEADQVVCLGDAVQGGPQPAEVLDRLRELGCPVVLGNADAFLLDPEVGSKLTAEHHEVREWTVAQLSPAHLDQIRAFQSRIELDLGSERTLLAFHGSPDDYDDLIFAWTPEPEFRAFLEGHEAEVYAGGHVHQQFHRRMGDAIFVNPGSVGLSWEFDQSFEDLRIDPFACYAVLGDRSIEFRRVPFDLEPLFEIFRASGIPHVEKSLRQWQPR